MKERYAYLDFLRGFGIFLVVWGHTPNCPIVEYIYSFHMPLFIFISGFLHKNNKKIIDYCLNKVIKLVIPFYFYSILSWLIYLFITFLLYKSQVVAQLGKLVYIILGSGQNAINVFGMGNIVLWFLPCLFFVSISYYVIERFVKNDFLILLIVVFVSFLGWLCSIKQLSLPFSLDSAFIVFPFYFLGHKFNRYAAGISKTPNFGLVLFVILLVVIHVVVYQFNAKVNGGIDVSSAKTGNYILFYIAATAASLYCFIVSYFVKEVKIFNFFGEKSIIVLLIHLPLIQILSLCLMKLNITGLPSFFVACITLLICIPLINFIEKRIPYSIGNISKPLKQKIYSIFVHGTKV